MMRRGVSRVLLLLISLTGCGGRVLVKSPPDRGAPVMTFAEAKQTVEGLLGNPKTMCSIEAYNYYLHDVSNVHVTPDALELTYETSADAPVTPLRCDLKSLDPVVTRVPFIGHAIYQVQAGEQCGIRAEITGMPATERYCDALYTLRHAALGDLPAPAESDADKAAFQKVVADYRAAAVKPELPEDARRFKVQAEAAVREKRDDDAIDLFDKALSIAPWWPEGHYNRALLLGEAGRKPEAIREMKKYLALEPNAPDARAAQDKIYEWGG